MPMTETQRLQDALDECKEVNKRLLAENVDLKTETAQIRARLKYFELFATDACKICVDREVKKEIGRMKAYGGI